MESESECERESLHLSGAIQSHGALLRIDRASNVITHASANLCEFTSLSAKDVLGRVALDVLGEGARDWPEPEASQVRRCSLKLSGALQPRTDVESEAGDRSIYCVEARVIAEKDQVLVELESVRVSERGKVRVPRSPFPAKSDGVEEGRQWLLEAISDVAEFDRILIYRFYSDWSGEVIAERIKPGIDSYLGLRFPKSDIPQIARSLYQKNACRTIADAAAPAVPLLSAASEEGRGPPDLTYSELRSVSPVHIQYLKNMRVGASFSVPIRTGADFWGLLTCHHNAPTRLSPAQREACVGHVQQFAIGTRSRNLSSAFQTQQRLNTQIFEWVQTLHPHGGAMGAMSAQVDHLTKLGKAHRFAFALESNMSYQGGSQVPEEVQRLDAWFQQHPQVLFASDRWPLGQAPAGGECGVLAVKSRMVGAPVRLYWFREEEAQEIAWGGNPHKLSGKGKLSPRASFDKWVEVRRGSSRPWSEQDRMMATIVSKHLRYWRVRADSSEPG